MNSHTVERFNLPKTSEELSEFIMGSDEPMTVTYNRGVCLVWISRRWDIMQKYCEVLYGHQEGLTIRCPQWFDKSERVTIPMPKELKQLYEGGR